jgi:hypothetical protein
MLFSIRSATEETISRLEIASVAENERTATGQGKSKGNA